MTTPSSPPPPEDTCPGPCNTAWEAAERRREADGTEHALKPNLGEPVFCRHCQDTIHAALGRLVDAASHLTPGALNTPRETATGGSHRLSASPSLSPGWDEADAVIRWAVTWEDRVRTWCREPLPHRSRRPEHRYLTAATAYLQARVTAALSHGDDSVAFGLETLRWGRRLTRVTGQDRLVVRVPADCPRCGRRGLTRRDGDDLVRCRACCAVWDRDHFELLVRAALDTRRA